MPLLHAACLGKCWSAALAALVEIPASCQHCGMTLRSMHAIRRAHGYLDSFCRMCLHWLTVAWSAQLMRLARQWLGSTMLGSWLLRPQKWP